MPTQPLRLLTLGLLISPSLSYAQITTNQDWKVCPVPLRNNNTLQAKRPAGLAPEATYLEADSGVLQKDGDSTLDGNVLISQDQQALSAEHVVYNQPNKQVDASGNVQLTGAALELNSDRIHYNFDTQEGDIFAAHYQIPNTSARGKSSHIFRQGKDLSRLYDATYTTCPPNKESWRIQAGSIELNQAQGRGVAKNVKFLIKDTPVFYFPYFSFPLGDERKSGFLTPAIKHDNNSGFQLSLPYYFNLAPNYDWTLTPILLSKRGVMFGNEFRYLQPKYNGSINVNILPSDRQYNDKARYQFDINHQYQGQLNGRPSKLSIKAGGVSDNDYINDFGGSLAATSTINIERNITYNTEGKNWSLSAVAQNYQILDNGTVPFTRLPQITWNYRVPQKIAGFKVEANSEYTHFYSANQTDADRAHFNIRASQRFSNSWGFLEPSLSLNHTAYRLGEDSTTQKYITRTLPTVSLDSGLIFERNFNEFYLQTLEPRAFYTYTPYKDQAAIPIFDSAEKSFDFNQLFSEYRFTGKDRIGDNNRLATSVTMRLQNKNTGREKLRVGLGQNWYFADRRVTMPDQTSATGKRSEIVMETSGELNARTRLTGNAFFDTNSGKFSAGQLDLNYKDDKGRSLNLGYGQRKDSFEAAKVSFSAPIRQNWKVAGSWNYDLENKRTLETVSGLEYESCCWKTRIAARKYLLPDNTNYDNAGFIEFELKGLGSLGNGARALLRDRITGYE